MFSRNRYVMTLFSFLFLITSIGAIESLAGQKDSDDQAERAREAAEVLNEMMAMPEQGIPEDLMSRAHAVAVIPGVTKAALGLGGRWGKGLVSHRGEDGKWSTPSYLEITGGSAGFQIGVERTDLVLVFTNNEGFKSMLDGKLKIGAEAAATAGPVGRNAEVGTDILLKSAIWSYSRSKGLFAGVSLDGTVLEIDDSGNEKAYGRKLSAEEILLGNKVKMNTVVAPFVQALTKYSPTRKVSQK